jgi:hypothetical protein
MTAALVDLRESQIMINITSIFYARVRGHITCINDYVLPYYVDDDNHHVTALSMIVMPAVGDSNPRTTKRTDRLRPSCIFRIVRRGLYCNS